MSESVTTSANPELQSPTTASLRLHCKILFMGCYQEWMKGFGDIYSHSGNRRIDGAWLMIHRDPDMHQSPAGMTGGL
jgi:hypothetical protein